MNKKHKAVEMEAEITFQKNIPFPRLKVQNAKVIDQMRCPPNFLGLESELPSEIERWLDKRLISSKRKSLQKLPTVRWEQGNPNFLSMSDQYWILAAENTDDTWDKLNFYDNKYSDIIGQISASYNKNDIRSLMFPKNSPDLCTNGLQDKMWKRIEGENYLLKWTNNEEQQAILSEILATEILENLNMIPFVHYKLYIENYRLCSCCKNFVDQNEEFVPAWYIYRAYENLCLKEDSSKEDIYNTLLKAADYFNIANAKEDIDRMIIVDRIIMNFDRHLGNFGFMRDVDTGKYTRFAPLFDFGNAFFPDKMETTKERYIFGNRMKELLCDEKIVKGIKVVKEATKSPYLNIPEFIGLKDIIIRNINLNTKELEIDIESLKKKKRERKKDKDNISMSIL